MELGLIENGSGLGGAEVYRNSRGFRPRREPSHDGFDLDMISLAIKHRENDPHTGFGTGPEEDLLKWRAYQGNIRATSKMLRDPLDQVNISGRC